jgi:ABC-type multidrug transport system permease subunit
MNNYFIVAIILYLKILALPLIAIFLYCLYFGLSFEMEMLEQSSHRGKRRK